MLAAVGTRPAPLCPFGWRGAQDSSWITNSIYEDLRRVLYHIVPHAIWSYSQSRLASSRGVLVEFEQVLAQAGGHLLDPLLFGARQGQGVTEFDHVSVGQRIDVDPRQ